MAPRGKSVKSASSKPKAQKARVSRKAPHKAPQLMHAERELPKAPIKLMVKEKTGLRTANTLYPSVQSLVKEFLLFALKDVPANVHQAGRKFILYQDVRDAVKMIQHVPHRTYQELEADRPIKWYFAHAPMDRVFRQCIQELSVELKLPYDHFSIARQASVLIHYVVEQHLAFMFRQCAKIAKLQKTITLSPVYLDLATSIVIAAENLPNEV